MQSGGWVINNNDQCPNNAAYTQPPDNCGVCGGNNIHNFVDQHTQVLCFPSPSTWNSNGVSHSIAPYPYDENTKMYSYEIGGCTHKVELSIGWIVPDNNYNCNGNLSVEVGNFMQGGVVFEVDNNIATIAYQPAGPIVFLTLDGVEYYCDNLSFTWGDGQIYDDWQVSTDINALGNHALDGYANLYYGTPYSNAIYNLAQCIRYSSYNYSYFGN